MMEIRGKYTNLESEDSQKNVSAQILPLTFVIAKGETRCKKVQIWHSEARGRRQHYFLLQNKNALQSVAYRRVKIFHAPPSSKTTFRGLIFVFCFGHWCIKILVKLGQNKLQEGKERTRGGSAGLQFYLYIQCMWAAEEHRGFCVRP